MQLLVSIYYRQLIMKNGNLKCAAISQRSFNSFWLFYSFFLPSLLFLLSLFKLSCTKKHDVYNLYCISYTSIIFNVMYCMFLGTRISGHVLQNCFYCYWNFAFESDWNTLILFLKKDVPSELNMFPGKMCAFISFPLFGFTLIIKLRNFDFQRYWSNLIFFDQTNDRFEYILPNSVRFGLGFVIWVESWH